MIHILKGCTTEKRCEEMHEIWIVGFVGIVTALILVLICERQPPFNSSHYSQGENDPPKKQRMRNQNGMSRRSVS
jgi:hypothetical protein